MYKNFTLVIPTYNSSKYMEELLSSALKFLYLNEIIIVDDNSNQDEYDLLNKIVFK